MHYSKMRNIEILSYYAKWQSSKIIRGELKENQEVSTNDIIIILQSKEWIVRWERRELKANQEASTNHIIMILQCKEWIVRW